MFKAKSKRAPDPARVAVAVETYRTQVLAFCDQRLGVLCDRAEPMLLRFAELADDARTQTVFFSAAAQLTENRTSLGLRFREIIDQGLRHFFSPERTNTPPWPYPPDSASALNLAGDERDEALALRNLIVHTNAHCFPELYALSQRLAALAGGSKLRDYEIPAGPHHLVQGFRAALAEDGPDIRVRVVLYALFHHRIGRSAASLYGELNATLRDAGVLPKTRPVNLRQSRQQRAYFGSNQQHAEVEDPEAELQALLGDLLELDASREASRQPHTDGSAPPDTLTEFLRHIARLGNHAEPPLLPPGYRAETIAVISLDRPRASARDAELIGAIEGMFARMFHTPGLPALAKVALGQLQIPYLKAGLNDIGLVRDPSHPARLLLDECVEAGCRWIDESDPRQGVLPALEDIAARILDTPEDEPPPFADLLTCLHHSTRGLRQTRERRTRELRRDRADAREALSAVHAQLHTLLRHHEIPRQARVFLETTWVELLTLVRLHQEEGPDSPSWREAVDTARTLVELFDPRLSGGALHTRLSEIPRLRQRLTYGAQRLGSHNHATLGALDSLLASPHTIREQLRRAQRLPARPPRALPALPLEPPAGALATQPTPEPDTEREELPEEALQAMIDELRKTKSGTWFELDSPMRDQRPTEQPPGRRIQLSWISPLTSTYLFIDESGTKTEMRGLRDLALAMLSGRARVLNHPKADSPKTASAESSRLA